MVAAAELDPPAVGVTNAAAFAITFEVTEVGAAQATHPYVPATNPEAVVAPPIIYAKNPILHVNPDCKTFPGTVEPEDPEQVSILEDVVVVRSAIGLVAKLAISPQDLHSGTPAEVADKK